MTGKILSVQSLEIVFSLMSCFAHRWLKYWPQLYQNSAQVILAHEVVREGKATTPTYHVWLLNRVFLKKYLYTLSLQKQTHLLYLTSLMCLLMKIVMRQKEAFGTLRSRCGAPALPPEDDLCIISFLHDNIIESDLAFPPLFLTFQGTIQKGHARNSLSSPPYYSKWNQFWCSQPKSKPRTGRQWHMEFKGWVRWS